MEKAGFPEPAPPYTDKQFLQPLQKANQEFVPIPAVFIARPDPPPQTHTVVQLASITLANQLRDKPIQLKCPKCMTEVETRVKYETGRMTHIAAAVLCLIGCVCGCCLMPFCVNSCKDVQHECPQCNYYIGNYRR